MFKLGRKIGLVGRNAINLCERRQLVRLEQDTRRPAKRKPDAGPDRTPKQNRRSHIKPDRLEMTNKVGPSSQCSFLAPPYHPKISLLRVP